METKFSSKRNIFFLIILIIPINFSSSYLAFQFPYAFKLNNRNILVIHQLGVTICDETFTESIKRVVTFSDSEKITTDASLSKISSVKADAYVICLINDIIYVFDQEGNFKKKSEDKITSFSVEYYSLEYTFKESNYLYFVIGFFYNKQLKLYSYKYHILQNTISEHISLTNANSFSSSYIIYNGLSCHYMKYSSSSYYFICFYFINKSGYYLAIDYFKISSSSFQKYDYSKTFNIEKKAYYIKAALFSNKSKLFIGWIASDGVPYYWMYDINQNVEKYVEHHYTKTYCQLIPHGFKVNHYSEKSEIIYTCIFESNTWTVRNANILVESMNENFVQTNYTYKYNGCNLHGYSIVYLDAKRNYYIISDVNCASKLYPLNLLFGNLKEEEITVHTEAIKEEVVVIEEEEEEEMQHEEENILDYLEEEKTDLIEEEKTHFFEKESVILIEEEKIDLIEEEKSDSFEEEKVNFFEEEKIDSYKEEKSNSFEEEKTNYFEEEKIDIYEEEKSNSFEEEKTNYFEEEKIDIYEEENIDLVKEEEKVKEFEKEKEAIKEELEEEKEKEKETEKEIKHCKQLEKCLLCNEESISLDLCIKCNNLKDYYFLNIHSIPKEELNDQYIDCVNEETKPSKFYFDSENEDYRPCYQSCATCDTGGNYKIHNCKTCEENYIPKPDTIATTNCVIKCPSYYYYSINNQYKCTEEEYCPLNYILLIKEKGKCTNNCKRDDTYNYQYDNQCLKQCPDNTINDSVNYLCKDKDITISTLTETNHTFFDKNFTDEEMAQLVQNFMKNFYYTNNHISTYKSNNYTIAIYKNGETITNLSLSIPKINFENCYSKIKEENNITDDLIIVLESEKIDKENDKIISFSVYDPRNGQKIKFNDLCINYSVIVQEELGSKIPNLNSFIYLTNQGIDLLNPNSDFYTDLCFHFKSPYDGKDIPLKERFELFFPNVSLCEKGCSIKGINGTTNTSICECTLNNLINNDIIGGNIFFQSAMVEVKTLLQETNIEILRCYKDLFHIEFYVSNYGSFILLGLILIQIILTIIYYKKFIFSMRKYLFNLSQTYLLYLSKQAIPQFLN